MATSDESDNGKNKSSRVGKFLREVYRMALIGAFLTVAFRYIQARISFAFNTITTFIGNSWLILLGVPLIFLIGYLLYRFKKKKQVWYGTVEIAFGLATAWSGIARLQGERNIGALTAVAASAYLVQRGFSNYNESS